MKTNKDKLVKLSMQGKIHHPTGPRGIRVHSSGEPMALPAVGGITYNVKIGDDAFGLAGDHVEPGVTIRNEIQEENSYLMTYSCIGNLARVVSGKADGAKGYVTGMHGGIEHVICYFSDEDMAKMKINDEILIETYGQGIKLLDYPDIFVHTIDPDLLEAIDIKEENGCLVVPVAGFVPAYLMGSGIGSANPYSGDYDLQTGDMNKIRELGLDKLKFGDLVLLQDCDNVYGRGYYENAVSIGVVIHSDCMTAGHGPGITTIMTSKKPLIKGVLDKTANIGKYYNIEHK